MKKVELQKYKFDGRLRLATFFGLITLAVALQIVHSALASEVVAAVIVLAGVSKNGR